MSLKGGERGRERGKREGGKRGGREGKRGGEREGDEEGRGGERERNLKYARAYSLHTVVVFHRVNSVWPKLHVYT